VPVVPNSSQTTPVALSAAPTSAPLAKGDTPVPCPQPGRSCRYSLADLGLVDGPVDDVLTQITELAAQLVGAPVSLVSLVQPELDRQFFAAFTGLAEPWAEQRQTPLTHSFCRTVVKTNDTLEVVDATLDERVQGNGAIEDLGVIAYLGVPIHTPDGRPVGAVCTIDGVPRPWTDKDHANLGRLAAVVDEIIRHRAEALSAQETHAAIRSLLDSTCCVVERRSAPGADRAPTRSHTGA
jgi:GAF domain-containing protein